MVNTKMKGLILSLLFFFFLVSTTSVLAAQSGVPIIKLGVPNLTDVQSLWNRTSGNLFPKFLGDNVGIGTTNPTHKFNVQGVSNLSGNTLIEGELNITNGNKINVIAPGAADWGTIFHNTSNFIFESMNRTPFYFKGENVTIEKDLIVLSPNSILLGGIGFARISATNISVLGFSDILASIDKSWAVNGNSDSQLSNVVINVNRSENATSHMGLLNFQGLGAAMIKFNANYKQPNLAQIGNNFGTLEMVSRNDGNNNITFGFFDDTIRGPLGSVRGLINGTRVIEIENNISVDPFRTNINFGLNVKGNLIMGDSINMSNNSITDVPFIDFITNINVSTQEGRMWWNEDEKTLQVGTGASGVVLQLGQENYIRGRNTIGQTIFNGQVVFINGAQGNLPTVDLAISNDTNRAKVIAIATHDCSNNNNCFFTTFGIVRDIDTASFSVGDTLYLSPTDLGNFTTSMPQVPNFPIQVATVLVSNVNEGRILVNIGPTDVASRMVIDGLDINTNFTVTDNITTSDTFIGNFFKSLTGSIVRFFDNVLIDKDLNVTGNITSENVFVKQYIFAHTNKTQPVLGAGEWTNLTLDQEETHIKSGIGHNGNDNTNSTFTINKDGIYNIEFDYDMIDFSPGATDIDMAGRLIFINGTEIDGSAFESDITKQEIETEIAHSILAELRAGDKIIFQFIADDADVSVSTHGTFGDHPDSATIIIEKVANI